MSISSIRLLVADDHPVVRDGLVSMLSTQNDFEIVGQADNGHQTVILANDLHPDVILLDLEMPEMDGVEVIQELRSVQPDIKVLVFTAFDTDERILGAVQAGAQGYLLKGVSRDELFNAVRIIHQGGSLLQPIVASKLIQRVSQSKSDFPEKLTPRELEVLRLLAQGLQNKEIALELVISERTVKFHVSSILQKLDAGNRTEAVTTAIQHGLVKPE
ncbi:MAG: response regulator transcription factor [Chloroflexi bacterium]|nr:response regulator transcription factor [Chloroflexota bacterium]